MANDNAIAEITLKKRGDRLNIEQTPVELIDAYKAFRIGDEAAPHITHDNGFLDYYPKREPTSEDYKNYFLWVGRLRGAQLICGNPITRGARKECNGEDLKDATDAYQHFLEGSGKPRNLNYERFITEDVSGRILLRNSVAYLTEAVEVIGDNRSDFFTVVSSAFNIAGMGDSTIAPYPSTANWQKAIGAHMIWIFSSIKIKVKNKKIFYDAKMRIHAEDMYNFNPGAKDIQTGIPDSANGQFELCGLAKQYMNCGLVERNIGWFKGAKKNEIKIEKSGR